MSALPQSDQNAGAQASHVLRILANRIFVVICAITFTISVLVESGWTYLNSLGKMFLIGVFAYLIMFIFHQSGGRSITETYLMSLAILSSTYFAVAASWSLFLGSVALSVVLAICFQFLD
jgi:hypothetical protein